MRVGSMIAIPGSDVSERRRGALDESLAALG
jgi:hypothetical protein